MQVCGRMCAGVWVCGRRCAGVQAAPHLVSRLDGRGVREDGNVCIKLPRGLRRQPLIHQHHALAYLYTGHARMHTREEGPRLQKAMVHAQLDGKEALTPPYTHATTESNAVYMRCRKCAQKRES